MRGYRILILDHFHFMDRDSEYYEKETYLNYESALARAKLFTDESLADHAKPGMSAEDIFGMWASWGESPLIISGRGGDQNSFHARDYARTRAEFYVIPADAEPPKD